MPTQLSPGVIANEFSITGIVPAVATTEGAIAGVFGWGPVDTVELVSSEDFLLERYGKPTNLNPETWFTAASFLSYGNRLYTVRAADTTGNNFIVAHTNSTSAVNVATNNQILFLNNTSTLSAGMKIYYTNNALIPIGASITDVFATYVVLNDTVAANVANVEVGFAEGNVTFSAVALQSDGSFDLGDVADLDGQIVKSENHYTEREANGQTFDAQVLYVARFPGDIGNSLRVSVVDTNTQFKVVANLVSFADNTAALNASTTYISSTPGSNTLTFSFTPLVAATAGDVTAANVAAGNVHATISVGDLLEVGGGSVGIQYMKVTSLGTVAVNATTNVYSFSVTTEDKSKLSNAYTNTTLKKYWEFYNSVDVAPGQSDYVLQFGNSAAMDELHVVVVDEGGKFTGSPGTVLEVYPNVSRATDAKSNDGASIYYKNIINDRSKYIWWANDRTTAESRTAALIRTSTATKPLNMRLQGGTDGGNESIVPLATIMAGYDKFRSEEEMPDISLILQGKARGESVSQYTQLANYLIDNITEARKDCVAFVSPHRGAVVDNRYSELESILAWRAVLRSTSYAVADSGYKYMYDKYNDVFRWIPLNGDIAGLCARTDATNDAWWSPAGFNRGKLKNAIRVAFNPNLSERDSLYKDGVNPVVSMKGEGILLYGDKTLLAKPDAFDRINVRRLFIVLKKAISRASKYFLFEFNDDFTRTQFRSIVNPYLRDIQGRRGIYAFEVRCDENNNTAEVIDRNEFVGDIYIKPARSINFIRLNFIAVRTGVNFSEIIGKF